MLKIIMKNINNAVLNQIKQQADENKKFYSVSVDE